MEKLNLIFGKIKMTWPKALLLSAAVTVFSGVLGGISDSSFTDMAGGYEFWVVLAVIITVNCEKFWDAGLKCGAFFLITQPGQFFIQALLYSHNYSNALHYTRIWLPVIIATIPGGMIAHFAKKENIWGSIILGLGNTIVAVMLVNHFNALLEEPPRHLLSTLFSIAAIIVMTLFLQKKTKWRIVSFAIAVVLTAAIVVYAAANGLQI